MKKSKKVAAEAGTHSQLPDSKGINPARDAGRRKGGAGIPSLPKGGGTAKRRKASRVPE